MKKQFLFLAILLIVNTMQIQNANAQNHEDVIYLKNGSVIKGIVIEQQPNESLKIRTRDGNVLVYQMSEVDKMTRLGRGIGNAGDADYNNYEEMAYGNSGYRRRSNEFNTPKGYLGLVDFGVGIGLDKFKGHRISLAMINGYRVAPQFAMGVGIGIHGLFHGKELNPQDEAIMPIFLHLRSDFTNRRMTPFLAFNVGYNLSLTGGYVGGILLEPALGVGFNVGSTGRIMTGLSCIINRVYYVESLRMVQREISYTLGIKVGYSF